jgi:hypothetical protein
MINRLVLAALCVVFFSVNAEARQRHKPTAMHPDCNRLWPCIAPYASTPEQVRVTRGKYIARQVGFGGPNVARKARSGGAKVARAPRQSGFTLAPQPRQSETYGAPSPSLGYTIAKPLTFIAGQLRCAVNVGAALAERGIKGTGSALARSYDRWGRSSGPVPGGVAVTDRGRRGGHVAIISRVEGSRVWAWNPGRRGWREVEYTSRRARYRVASQ